MNTVSDLDRAGAPPALKNLLVIGGADGIGNWIVRRVFAHQPTISRITIMDVASLERIPAPRHTSEVFHMTIPIDAINMAYGSTCDTPSYSWKPVQTNAIPPTSNLMLSEYQIVMLAVPEKEMKRVCTAVLPHLSADVWIFDVCSSKVGAIQSMLDSAPNGASIVGTHPLFGPLVSNMVGQTVVLTQTERSSQEHLTWLKSVYADQGALVVPMAAEKHDRNMVYVQGLTHFVYLAFAKALSAAMQEGFALDESFQVMTPPFKALIAFVGRILGSPSRVYSQIQAQPATEDARKFLQQAITELAERFASGNEQEIEDEILKIKDAFESHHVSRGVGLASAYVERLQDYYHILHAARQEGRFVVVRVQDPLKVHQEATYHPGIIEEYDAEYIYLKQLFVKKTDKYFVVHDAASRRSFAQSAKHYGLPTKIPHTKQLKIRHQRAHVLSQEATRTWRQENLQHHTFDLPLIMMADAISMVLPELIQNQHKDVVKAKVFVAQDADWLQRYGLCNYLLRCTVFGDCDPDECRSSVVRTLDIPGVYIHNQPHKNETPETSEM